MAEGVCPLKAECFLLSGVMRAVISHQGGKNAKGQPAKHQILRSIGTKTAEVGTGVQKTAEVQRRHHFDIQK